MFQIQPLSQMDPRWKEHTLGFGTASTIGKYGCLLTCMTMVANGFGAQETPATLNDKMSACDGFLKDLIKPAMLSQAAPQAKYSKRIQFNNPPAPLSIIDAALASGFPVIVKVDYSPIAGIQDHWIVLTGKQGSDYLIQDPWPYPAETKPVLLTARYGFHGAPDHIILDAIFYEGKVSPPPPIDTPQPDPKLAPAAGLIVYATADQLALRASPEVSDNNLIERMPMGAKILVLEDAAQAGAKIGQMNMWLNVQVDADGHQGYAAAWYVSLNPAAVPVVPPQSDNPPIPPSTQLIVYAAVDGLAVRSQPLIADSALIKRVPQNTPFTVLEPPDQARAKIGVNGQWLHIQDVQGTQGYAAAWYLSPSQQEPALGVGQKDKNPPPQSVPPAIPLVVRTTDSGVALRSQPVIATTTLIKRLPAETDLVVLEPAAAAAAKLGVVNQWINVKDINGVVGYVAAWYVVKSPLPVPAPNTP